MRALSFGIGVTLCVFGLSFARPQSRKSQRITTNLKQPGYICRERVPPHFIAARCHIKS